MSKTSRLKGAPNMMNNSSKEAMLEALSGVRLSTDSLGRAIYACADCSTCDGAPYTQHLDGKHRCRICAHVYDAIPRLTLHLTPDHMVRLEATALREQTSVMTLACLAILDRVAASEAKKNDGICPACESKPTGPDGRAAFCSDHGHEDRSPDR
jgi:hypothetical protein